MNVLLVKMDGYLMQIDAIFFLGVSCFSVIALGFLVGLFGNV